MRRLLLRTLLSVVTLAGLFVIVAPEPTHALTVSCQGRPDGFASASEDIYQYRNCPFPPPQSTNCKVGVMYCTWWCQNQQASSIQCNPQFCLGYYGDVTCCDGTCPQY